MKKIDVLIMAAGVGKRFGQRKQFLKLGKFTILNLAVKIFMKLEEIADIIVVYPPDMKAAEVRKKAEITDDVVLVRGNVKREKSVLNGLNAVKAEYVLIHDAVRPACSEKLVRNVIVNTLKYNAVVPGINPADTVKLKFNKKVETVDRNNLFLIQTPQGYKTTTIKEAYKAKGKNVFTDSSSVAENYGVDVKIISGEKNNIKVTRKEDYRFLEVLLGE